MKKVYYGKLKIFWGLFFLESNFEVILKGVVGHLVTRIVYDSEAFLSEGLNSLEVESLSPQF